MKKNLPKYLAIAIVTAGLLYLSFRGQYLIEAASAIANAHPVPLLIGIAIMFLSHAVRAYRWQIVMRPMKRHTRFREAYGATIAGYAMNNLIPRSGEFVRPYLVSKAENIPVAGALASVVVERLADVIALAVLIAYSLLVYQARVTSVFPMFNGTVISGLALMLLLLISLILMFFSERRTQTLIRIVTTPLPKAYAAKIEEIALDFSKGLRGLDRSATAPLILGTIGIWGLYGISMFASLQAFPNVTSGITLPDAFLLLTLSGIAFTIPTPGGTGSYHLLISTGLTMIFGVPASIAAAYAIATHALSFIFMTVVGLVILIRDGFTLASASSLAAKPIESKAEGANG